MDGCSAPIVVKFADTQKEKEQKKMQQMQANLWNLATANMNISGKLNMEILFRIKFTFYSKKSFKTYIQ